MKISVAMATYNGAQYIEEQLESIRIQTMPVDEVRICDDGSSDDTVEVICHYIREHGLESSWSVEVNQENLGYASNFMKAVGLTNGDYVFFCDQDDIWIADRAERMIGLMEAHPDMLLLGSEFDSFVSAKDAPSVPGWEQTMPVDEVRICDDGSSDDTVEVICHYIREHGLESSWSVEVNQENLGYASNFMKAVGLTNGDYVFFCDQDDIWIADRAERMIGLMEAHPDMLLLGSEFDSFVSAKDAPSVPGWEQKMIRNDESLEKMQFTPANIFIGCQGCTMCMRRQLLERAMPYWYKGWAHDEFVWKLALCMDGLYMYHSYTLRRRLHSNNVTMRKVRDITKRLKYLTDLQDSHMATLKYARENGLSKSQLALLEKNIKATRLRIELLRNKKLWNIVPLTLFYRECYHKCRAIPVELMMAVRN